MVGLAKQRKWTTFVSLHSSWRDSVRKLVIRWIRWLPRHTTSCGSEKGRTNYEEEVLKAGDFHVFEKNVSTELFQKKRKDSSDCLDFVCLLRTLDACCNWSQSLDIIDQLLVKVTVLQLLSFCCKVQMDTRFNHYYNAQFAQLYATLQQNSLDNSHKPKDERERET